METKAFIYETYYDNQLNFEIDDENFKYRLDQGEQVIAQWSDLYSIKINRFGNTLDIFIKDRDKPITVPFGTENFLVFLEELTQRLARANQDTIESQNQIFTVSKLFYAVMAVILPAPILLLSTLLFNLQVLEQLETPVAVAAFVIPIVLIIYGVGIPIRAFVKKEGIVVKGLIRTYTYAYSKIESITFELKDMKKRGSLLIVVLIMKNGKKVKIQWLKDLITFFMVVSNRFDQYREKSPD